ncbi:MAG: ABC transporter substrate-binding protein [Paracoccaceae bacterium]|nr:ABC transporter substrate-binding protein [Paracoccaceae bacterium]
MTLTKTMLSLTAALAFAGGAALAEVESQDPIKLTLHDWTGQLITTNIMAAVLEEAGYNVELVQADYLAQFSGLESGDLHVAMELWATTAADALNASLATGKTVNFGENGMQAIEEWWYPDYMKEQCPGLPDWKALNDCAALFATADTAPKGRYLGGPVTWGGFDDERVDALGLNYEVIHAGTDAAMFAELESAYQRRAPILVWVYAPHWAPLKYKGEWVKFPEYEPACYTDPAWGINPDKAYDCGKPHGPVWKAGWAGLEGKWPGAFKAITAFTISNDEMGAMVGKVDLDGQSVEDVVDEWMETNEAIWATWIAK